MPCLADLSPESSLSVALRVMADEITVAKFSHFVESASYRREEETSGKGSWRAFLSAKPEDCIRLRFVLHHTDRYERAEKLFRLTTSTCYSGGFYPAFRIFLLRSKSHEESTFPILFIAAHPAIDSLANQRSRKK